MSQSAKRAAGHRAAEFVQDGMLLGLGTGSTVQPALERLAARIHEENLAVRGVPTSRQTEAEAQRLGIPLTSLEEVSAIDLTIDGADEIDGAFNMIKGGGGALLREKVVASLSHKELIVVDESKVVEQLGRSFPLPVEVVPFAQPVVAARLHEWGIEPKLRERDGAVFVSDNGNHILDCHFPTGIDDAAQWERKLNGLPGVVENGLFVGLAHTLVIGTADGQTTVRDR